MEARIAENRIKFFLVNRGFDSRRVLQHDTFVCVCTCEKTLFAIGVWFLNFSHLFTSYIFIYIFENLRFVHLHMFGLINLQMMR